MTRIEPKGFSPSKSMARITFEQLLEHRLALLSLGVIIIFSVIALAAGPITSMLNVNPFDQDILNRYQPPSLAHLLGTDEAGRDVLSRIIFGARISMTVALISAFSATLIGIVVGALSGYFGGFIDSALMRMTDALLSIPSLPLLILLAASDLSKIPGLSLLLHGEDSSFLKMIIILVIFSWMIQARLVRGEILALKEQEYVLAAKISGMSSLCLIVTEILPNVLSPVIVAVTLNIGNSILLEAVLSFLGLGIQPPTPSWGNMLNNAQDLIHNAPLLAVLPGLMILIVVISFNFLGDGLQDALDPKALRR